MELHEDLRELSFSISGIISKSVRQVYEAVADPEQLSHYFTTGGAQGRMESGTTVSWEFHDFPGRFPVEVVEAEPSERIVLRWEDQASTSPDQLTTVQFDFASLDDSSRTRVTISESSLQATAAGAQAAFGKCEGWTGMLAAMKVWLEHGIILREGFYK